MHLTYDDNAEHFKTFCIEFSGNLDKHVENNSVSVMVSGIGHHSENFSSSHT